MRQANKWHVSRELKRRLRLCKRLQYLDRGMPIYYRYKLRWKCFTRWLYCVDGSYQLLPPHLTKTLPRYAPCLRPRNTSFVSPGPGLTSHTTPRAWKASD